MPSFQLEVAADEVGMRADAFLAHRLGVSRSRAVAILETAQVSGRVVKPKTALQKGQKIVGENEDVAPSGDFVPNDVPLPPVLWEDGELLVINKPRGLSVHAGAGEIGPTLVDVFKARGVVLSGVGPTERAGIVHRLDKDTSGAMLICKTDAAHWKLAADFEARRVRKTYVALCNGVPPARGRIEAPIARAQSNRKKMVVSPEGRMSVTEYAITQKWERFAALQINLLTGRTHQIRAHLAYIHHPIVGDGLYGGLARALHCAPNPDFRIAVEKLAGQALHAQKLSFFHPNSGEEIEVMAPLPAVVTALWQTLEKG